MDLVLTGLGMISSVGRDAVTTCASIRAGIVHPSPVPDVLTLEPETNEAVPVTGHPIRPMTDGFAATARWLTMAVAAFDDLRRAGKLPPVADAAFWNATELVLVLPPLEDERFQFDPRCRPSAIEETYVDPLLRRLGLMPYRRRCRLMPEGRSGPFRAIAQMTASPSAAARDRTIILAVDSLLDGVSLQWLGEQQRLKTDANPAGLAPGEAAVALLVETRRSAERRNAGVLGSLVACVLAEEPQPYAGGSPPTGRALAEAVTACLSAADRQAPFEGDLFIDLNGEAWRAREYGGALVLIPRELRGAFRPHFGALSVGDVGAAAGALNIALAGRALDRGYAQGDVALAACSSEEGTVGVAALQRRL